VARLPAQALIVILREAGTEGEQIAVIPIDGDNREPGMSAIADAAELHVDALERSVVFRLEAIGEKKAQFGSFTLRVAAPKQEPTVESFDGNLIKTLMSNNQTMTNTVISNVNGLIAIYRQAAEVSTKRNVDLEAQLSAANARIRELEHRHAQAIQLAQDAVDAQERGEQKMGLEKQISEALTGQLVEVVKSKAAGMMSQFLPALGLPSAAPAPAPAIVEGTGAAS
jgi:hypothetical protein